MKKSSTRKATTQLGWRLRSDLITAFKKYCADERKDPVLELEFLIQGFLSDSRAKGPGGSGGKGGHSLIQEGDIIDESKGGGNMHAPHARRQDVGPWKSSR